jgi:hypothetical protein
MIKFFTSSCVIAHDGGVGSREKEFLVIAIVPLDDVRRFSLFISNFADYAMTIGLAHPMSSDQDVVTNFCEHGASDQ